MNIPELAERVILHSADSIDHLPTLRLVNSHWRACIDAILVETLRLDGMPDRPFSSPFGYAIDYKLLFSTRPYLLGRIRSVTCKARFQYFASWASASSWLTLLDMHGLRSLTLNDIGSLLYLDSMQLLDFPHLTHLSFALGWTSDMPQALHRFYDERQKAAIKALLPSLPALSVVNLELRGDANTAVLDLDLFDLPDLLRDIDCSLRTLTIKGTAQPLGCKAASLTRLLLSLSQLEYFGLELHTDFDCTDLPCFLQDITLSSAPIGVRQVMEHLAWLGSAQFASLSPLRMR